MTHETIEVRGLNHAAEIRVDGWGLAHLRAANKQDVFFLQGFNAARDRLWQIDLWRKRGLGRLAAHFGPGYLEQDVASRAFLYRGDMDAEWAAYAPDMREICEAFVAGINAFIDLAQAEPARLPPEFALTDTAPERWQADDVVRIRSHALTRNAVSEVLRSAIQSRYGARADLLRKNIEPAREAENAGDVDLDAVPLEILDLFKLATAGVGFSDERLAAGLGDAGKWRKVNDLAEVVADANWAGSNNWAVAAAHSATGRPIMAGDPHRAHAVPSLRYLVHMTSPEFDVIGAGEPAVPGISMGHNGTAAFTITIFGADQEDVYVYDINPDDADSYRYEDGWEPMTLVEETFQVKGHPDQTRSLRFTRHGPLLYQDARTNRAYALRSVWFEPGSGAYLAGVETMRAKTLPDFRAAVARFGAPALNHVYADIEGTIAWQPFGMTPVRAAWDGLLPVPGDGRFEWQGFLPLDAFPVTVSPDCGYVYSANEANLPEDWDHAAAQIGFEWLENSRARRIDEMLANGPVSLADAQALQTDTLSIPARRLGALLAGIEPGHDDDLRAALDLLAGWDKKLTTDSAAGLLSELWYTQHLRPALVALTIPDEDMRALMAPGDLEAILSALERPDDRFGDDPASGRDALLATTLVAAWADAAARFGTDPAQWAWGNLHHGFFEHPLGAVAGEEWRGRLDVGPLAKPGSASTVMHAAYRPQDFRVTTGASIRLVMDVGNWDASVFINAPGMSGDPRSPHYRDLAPLWARGEYCPLLYSREAVDESTQQTIVLRPAR